MNFQMESNFWGEIKTWAVGLAAIVLTWFLSRRKVGAETTKAGAEADKIKTERRKVEHDELQKVWDRNRELNEQLDLKNSTILEQKKIIERLTRKLNVYQTIEAAIRNKK